MWAAGHVLLLLLAQLTLSMQHVLGCGHLQHLQNLPMAVVGGVV